MPPAMQFQIREKSVAVPVKAPDFIIREKMDLNLFFRYINEATDTGFFSSLRLIFGILLLVVIVFMIILPLSIYIAPPAGMIFLMTSLAWMPALLSCAGMFTYKYRITDEYIEIKKSLFRDCLMRKTRIYWDEIKGFEKIKIENKEDEYIIKNDEIAISIFPKIYHDKDINSVTKIISIIEEKSHTQLKEVWK